MIDCYCDCAVTVRYDCNGIRINQPQRLLLWRNGNHHLDTSRFIHFAKSCLNIIRTHLICTLWWYAVLRRHRRAPYVTHWSAVNFQYWRINYHITTVSAYKLAFDEKKINTLANRIQVERYPVRSVGQRLKARIKKNINKYKINVTGS